MSNINKDESHKLNILDIDITTLKLKVNIFISTFNKKINIISNFENEITNPLIFLQLISNIINEFNSFYNIVSYMKIVSYNNISDLDIITKQLSDIIKYFYYNKNIFDKIINIYSKSSNILLDEKLFIKILTSNFIKFGVYLNDDDKLKLLKIKDKINLIENNISSFIYKQNKQNNKYIVDNFDKLSYDTFNNSKNDCIDHFISLLILKKEYANLLSFDNYFSLLLSQNQDQNINSDEVIKNKLDQFNSDITPEFINELQLLFKEKNKSTNSIQPPENATTYTMSLSGTYLSSNLLTN